MANRPIAHDDQQGHLFGVLEGVDPPEGDPTAPYHGGNPESEAAHDSLEARVKVQLRGRILALVDSKSVAGLTCDEIEKVLKMKHQTVSARLVEMLAAGVLIRTAKRRQTRSGRHASVVVTPQHWRPEMGLGARRRRPESGETLPPVAPDGPQLPA